MPPPLVKGFYVSCRSFIVFGHLLVCTSWRIGFDLGFRSLYIGKISVESWNSAAVDIEEVLPGAVDHHLHLFVTDVVKSFDTVD